MIASSNKKLLLLNSNQTRLSELTVLLSQLSDFEIIAVNTAEAAIDVLKKQSIDFIVSNIKLINFDGWRLARLVRSGVLQCPPDTPFVIIASTWCEHIAKTTAREFGINHLFAYQDRQSLLTYIKQFKQQTKQQKMMASVLVIEDNPDTLHLAERILTPRFKVDTAVDGELGLELWKNNSYSLVLLDVMLPNMTGNQVLEAIMQDTPNQSVVIMTANHSMQLAEELMLKGAADFVTKPFRAEQLRRVCESASRREDFIISNEQFADKVDSLKQSHEKYKQIHQDHQRLLDQLGTVIIELNQDGTIYFLNKAWHKLSGYTIEHSIQQSLYDFIEPDRKNNRHTSNELKALLSGELSGHSFEFKLKNQLAEDVWVEARFERSTNGNLKNFYSGTIDNITERILAQKDLEHLAMHDNLTGLFNRHYFETEVKQYEATAKRGNGPHALLYIDLDHFKVINDTLGHQQGDLILKETACLIQSRLRQTDILARVGGDEFSLLLPNTDKSIALKLADDICLSLDQQLCQIGTQQYKINCSIGIAEITGSESHFEEYMKQADIALFAAKKQGRNLAHIYATDDVFSKEMQLSMEWTRKLHHAVANDNLMLYFQPIVNIKSRKIEYYEALVRLTIEDKTIMPGEFIPTLEREGHMGLLDRQVITKAFHYLAQHQSLKKIAINLSAQGFSYERLVPFIEEKLAEYNIAGNRIIFELTESDSLSNITATKNIVDKIQALGCEFSIDDFGTGFSTFNYLKQLPAQSVKIDGSFIVDLASNSVDLALVKAIYEVANALNKKSVAEFVENEETLTILESIGVTYAQGYHLGKPQPIDNLLVKLQS